MNYIIIIKIIMITFTPNFRIYVIETPLKLVDIHNAQNYLTSKEYKIISNSFSVFSFLGNRNNLQEVSKIVSFLKDNNRLGKSKYYISITLSNFEKPFRKIWTAKNMTRYIYRLDLITKESFRYFKKLNSDIITIEKPSIPEEEFIRIILYNSLAIIENYEKGLINIDDNAAYYMSNYNYSILKLSREKGLF